MSSPGRIGVVLSRAIEAGLCWRRLPGLGCVMVALALSLTSAESATGATWHLQSPAPTGASSVFDAVSCPSTTACTAVGHAGAGALVERWNGVRWSIQRPAKPARSTSSVFDDVSCTSESDCTAVGSFHARANSFVLLERWNGRRWSIQRIPQPHRERSGSQLAGVSCTSRTACIAVGAGANNYCYEDPACASNSRAFAELWNGVSWSLQSTPGYALDSVACVSQTACTALGQKIINEGFPCSELLIEHWNRNGRNWTTDPAVDPIPGQLTAVSCLSATECTAVGYYSIPPGPNVPVVESTISPRLKPRRSPRD